MKDYQKTIISQYGSSPTLGMMISTFNDYIDPAIDIDAFYDKMWNVNTARGYGLDVWGRIVGVGRVLNIAEGKYWGYSEATNVSAGTYGESPFYLGQSLTSNFALSDDAYRILIFAKALSNICDGSTKAINRVMLLLFPGRGNCYVKDGLDMTMIYTFEFALTSVEAAIVAQSGILPKPCGVAATFQQIF